MRRFAVFAAFAFLAACTAQLPATELAAKARSGNAAAQLQLGDGYCEAQDAPKALYWWKQAARNSDSNVAMTANTSLGSYYLGQFANLSYYQPGKSKPIALCRGNAKAKPDYAQAEKYFSKCARPAYMDKSCELALGHLNNLRKNYARAYYWYATVLAYGLDNDFNNMQRYPQRHETLRLDHPALAQEKTLPAARKAAHHLSAAHVKKLNAAAQAYTRGQ